MAGGLCQVTKRLQMETQSTTMFSDSIPYTVTLCPAFGKGATDHEKIGHHLLSGLHREYGSPRAPRGSAETCLPVQPHRQCGTLPDERRRLRKQESHRIKGQQYGPGLVARQ